MKRSGQGVLGRLRERGLLPRKRLGQHFLHDPKLLSALAEDAGVGPDDWVFEVGTGPGTLTGELARRSKGVITVDVDPKMLAFARGELEEASNVEFFERDVLDAGSRIDPVVAARLHSLGSFLWVSNLPYGIASPLIVACVSSGLPWRSASLLVQEEVGERLAALPGRKSYGTLSVLVAYWARVRLGRRVTPGAFWPPPRVHSRVVHLEPHGPLGRPEEFARYAAWTRRLFQGRRKQLGGLLRSLLGPEGGLSALRSGGFEASLRPENLGPADFLLLAREFPVF